MEYVPIIRIFLPKEFNMLANSEYDKIKIMCELSALTWFLEKHALPEAERFNQDYYELLKNLKKDLEDYTNKLKIILK